MRQIPNIEPFYSMEFNSVVRVQLLNLSENKLKHKGTFWKSASHSRYLSV